MEQHTVTSFHGQKAKPKDFEERVIQINRVSKVVKGGRRMSFTALVGIGNKQGKVGIGLGKANEVKEAVRKGVDQAKKNLTVMEIPKSTIPFEITYKFKSAKVFMKPAAEGTGVIAGGATRLVLELLGVKDILTKQLGSTNPINNAKATYYALEELSRQFQTYNKRKAKSTT
ncbi:30S ribosomal protein S5 [Candidatus Wirthbacteria bacterium CG2_30_54_11]|uniref:Small ribosomal subunit protein uS5 n=1 Tax=Candidatus Wirthbacteria bacterium CG2_30_54_11 TaxID=1817892 RepID=A0A1J5J3Q8_9BACT|nr:MAG: 30S ribosomal protein S5 [Candidatus Wirthbacteria bacterium CG2_30_54_11]